MGTSSGKLRRRDTKRSRCYFPSRAKRLRIETLEDRRMLATFAEFIDPNPNSGNQFGHSVVPLATGNVVITSPFDDAGGTDTGAVYLFNGATGGLISTLIGSTANDRVGHDGVVVLKNGNYVVTSSLWSNDAIVSVGAVTFGDGTTGVSGVVSAANSLIGSTAFDSIGSSGVTALENGNYVVGSFSWDNGATADVGAVTFGNGTTGISGVVSASNSLVGSTVGDSVGQSGVVALIGGNYVVRSPQWNNGAATDAGAVTFGNGTTGISGVVSVSNSLVGSTASDEVGGFDGGVIALENGNYVVSSSNWDNGAATNAGAVTFGDGATGISGVVFPSNSLVGSASNDYVGSRGVMELKSGNYVVRSPEWNNGAATDAGAVTFGDGVTGISGVVSVSNSIVGSTSADSVGSNVVELDNGNYVVSVESWDNGAAVDVGAVTFGDGTTGISGTINASNSLVGSTAADRVGNRGVVALDGGNYVVSSSNWDNGGAIAAGAVTFGNGTTGISGVVSASNSLVGSTVGDSVGQSGVVALIGGNYVVRSPQWNNGAATDAGAVTFGNGISGVTGAVTIANSLVGSTTSDKVGSRGVVALDNGNYVVISPDWSNSAVFFAGAVTLGNGTSGISGVVNASNSLVGSRVRDAVGINGVVALKGGNYVVSSSLWNNGVMDSAGAVTFGDGSAGVSGLISANNSLVGSTAFGRLGSDGVVGLNNGDYVVIDHSWDNGAKINAGAITLGYANSGGISGVIDTSNSLVGSTAFHRVGEGTVTPLSNGNYVVRNHLWRSSEGGQAGSVVFGAASSGEAAGEITALNSAFGMTSNTELLDLIVDNINGNFYAPFLGEVGGRVRVGSQASGFQVAPSPDFDGDADIDGTDFLVWQREFGTLYDASDLTNWRASYGETSPLAADNTFDNLAVDAFALPGSTADISRQAQSEDISTFDASIAWEFAIRTSEETDWNIEKPAATEALFAEYSKDVESLAKANVAGDAILPDATYAPSTGAKDPPTPWLDDELLNRMFG